MHVERNAFTDPELPRGASQLFGVLCSYDQGYGCWAGRDTIAGKAHASRSSVDHWISCLQDSGYIVVCRRKDQPAMIFVDRQARRQSGMAVPIAEALLQRVTNPHESNLNNS